MHAWIQFYFFLLVANHESIDEFVAIGLLLLLFSCCIYLCITVSYHFAWNDFNSCLHINIITYFIISFYFSFLSTGACLKKGYPYGIN